MIISSINNVSNVKNYGQIKSSKQQNQTKTGQNENRNLLDYPKGYRPSFGFVEVILATLGFSGVLAGIAYAYDKYDAHLDKKYAKERDEEIAKVAAEISKDIQEVANKNHLSFEQAKIYQENYLKTAMIEPKGDGNEIGLNAIMGYNSVKYKLAVDVITPLVAKEKGVNTNGGRIPNGLLLYGPTGSGKTYMAEKTCEHLRHFGVNVVDLTLDSDSHEENAERIVDAFEKAKESYKETGKYTVINFTKDIDQYFKNRNSNPETIPEVSAFLSCADNCAKEGVTWIGTANNPKELDSAVIRAGRTDIKMPIGNMKDFAAADMLKYSLIKNGEEKSAEKLDYKKVVDTMKELLLVFTPAEYNKIVKAAQKQKLYPTETINENMILYEMYERYKSETQSLNPEAKAKFREDQMYIEEQEDSTVDLLSESTPTSVTKDAEEQLKEKWPAERPKPEPVEYNNYSSDEPDDDWLYWF